jgi:hypothetical protein
MERKKPGGLHIKEAARKKISEAKRRVNEAQTSDR